MFQCVCRWDRADNYRAEEQRKVKVERGKFWSVTKTLCYVVSFSMVARLSVLCPVTGLRAGLDCDYEVCTSVRW